jgi:hypothetical protein
LSSDEGARNGADINWAYRADRFDGLVETFAFMDMAAGRNSVRGRGHLAAQPSGIQPVREPGPTLLVLPDRRQSRTAGAVGRPLDLSITAMHHLCGWL